MEHPLSCPSRLRAPAASLLALALLLSACAAPGRGPQPATPQRPTFASSTATTAASTFELEAGFALDPGDSFDTPLTAKTGLTDQTEVFLGWSPYQSVEVFPFNARGSGPVAVGARHRFQDEDVELPGFAVQLVTLLPSGDAGKAANGGNIDFFAAAIADKEFEPIAFTGFYQLGLLDAPGAAGLSTEHAFAVAGSAAIEERLSVFGELAAVFDNRADTEEVFTTWGVAHPIADNLVLDAGIVLGISNDAPDLAVLVGVSWNAGPLLHRSY